MNKLKVGDIVVINSEGRLKGRKAFIEEIVIEPNYDSMLYQSPETIRLFSGIYSLYGLTINQKGNWYYGDYKGLDLKPTGETMSKKDLVWYKKNLLGGFARDIDVVIHNLGRTQGRNEERYEEQKNNTGIDPTRLHGGGMGWVMY